MTREGVASEVEPHEKSRRHPLPSRNSRPPRIQAIHALIFILDDKHTVHIAVAIVCSVGTNAAAVAAAQNSISRKLFDFGGKKLGKTLLIIFLSLSFSSFFLFLVVVVVVAVHATIRCYIGEEGWRYHHVRRRNRALHSQLSSSPLLLIIY